tara:strand:+ start:341 stop:694 length:354 start_codon:yes stop_codon:yes gene_type:complete
MGTLILFQIFFTIFTGVTVVVLVRKKKEQLVSTRTFLFWCILWLGGFVFVLLPETSSVIASILGIGRGVDFVVYSALVGTIVIVSNLHMKLLLQRREITRLTRALALLEERLSKKRK